jgi:hypothetical protein
MRPSFSLSNIIPKFFNGYVDDFALCFWKINFPPALALADEEKSCALLITPSSLVEDALSPILLFLTDSFFVERRKLLGTG